MWTPAANMEYARCSKNAAPKVCKTFQTTEKNVNNPFRCVAGPGRQGFVYETARE